MGALGLHDIGVGQVVITLGVIDGPEMIFQGSIFLWGLPPSIGRLLLDLLGSTGSG